MIVDSDKLELLSQVFEASFLNHITKGNVKALNTLIELTNHQGINIQMCNCDTDDALQYCITTAFKPTEYFEDIEILKQGLISRQKTAEVVSLLKFERKLRFKWLMKKLTIWYSMKVNQNNIIIKYHSDSPLFQIIMERDLLSTQAKYKVGLLRNV